MFCISRIISTISKSYSTLILYNIIRNIHINAATVLCDVAFLSPSVASLTDILEVSVGDVGSSTPPTKGHAFQGRHIILLLAGPLTGREKVKQHSQLGSNHTTQHMHTQPSHSTHACTHPYTTATTATTSTIIIHTSCISCLLKVS